LSKSKNQKNGTGIIQKGNMVTEDYMNYI